MNRKFISLAIIAAVLLSVAMLTAQAPPTQSVSPPQKVAESSARRFAVAPLPGSAVMVDTETGKSWTIHQSAASDEWMWIPTQQIDDLNTARNWLLDQHNAKMALEKGH